MKKALPIVITVFVVLNILLSGNALSWDENITHKSLSEFAAKNSVLAENMGDYMKNLGFQNGLDEGFTWNETKTLLEWIQEGAKLEDNSNALFPLPSTTSRSVNHFHNPLKPWNQAGLNDWIAVLHYTSESSVF